MHIAHQCSACGHEALLTSNLGPGPHRCEQCDAEAVFPLEPGAPASETKTIRLTMADVVPDDTEAEAEELELQPVEALNLHPDLDPALEEELSRDETVLWRGRPSRNPALFCSNPLLGMAIGVLLIAFGLSILGALLFVVLPSPTLGGNGRMALFLFGGVFGVVAALMGVLFLRGASGAEAQGRRYYVITNRRALVAELFPVLGPQIKSYYPNQLLGMERKSLPQVPGAGHLIFEHGVQLAARAPLLTGQAKMQAGEIAKVPYGFLHLDQLGAVEHLLRKTLVEPLELAMESEAASGSAVLSLPCACGLLLEVPSGLEGRSVKCPECAAIQALPAASDDDPSVGPFAGELQRNERLLWLGRPFTTLIFIRNLPYVFFGLGLLFLGIWLLLSGFFPELAQQVKGKAQAAPDAQLRGGTIIAGLVPLGIAGILFLVPLYRVWKAGRTQYAVTNRRAIVYSRGLLGPSEDSYSPSTLTGMRRRKSLVLPGAGDLIFRTVTVVRRFYNQGAMLPSRHSIRQYDYGFLALADLSGGERTVREALVDRFVDRLNRADQTDDAPAPPLPRHSTRSAQNAAAPAAVGREPTAPRKSPARKNAASAALAAKRLQQQQRRAVLIVLLGTAGLFALAGGIGLAWLTGGHNAAPVAEGPAPAAPSSQATPPPPSGHHPSAAEPDPVKLPVTLPPATKPQPTQPDKEPPAAKKGWVVVFCSSDPAIWNKDVNRSPTDFALSLAGVAKDIRYLRLRKGDDAVIVPMTRDRLTKTTDSGRYGWEGTTRKDSGALHLGIYSNDKEMAAKKKGDIGIRILPWYRGWGFGHITMVNTAQGYSWEGKPLGKTVFEIAVTSDHLTEEETPRLLK